MWDKLREQVTLERGQLQRLLRVHQSLLAKCATSPLNEIELSALAAMLHSFYTGLENIFKRTTLELADPMPGGESWHKELLDGMTEPTGSRKPLISSELSVRLKEYMEFRHFFRHAYIFTLNWDRMKNLVLGSEQTLRLVEDELDRFFKSAPRSGQ